MKKIVSILLSIVFIMSSMSLVAFAEEIETQELTNVARNENGTALAYASSEKNTLWTPARSLIDGSKSSDTWQGWECAYPDVIFGSDTSAGFSGEYCGVKFIKKEYYEIYEINMNVGMHAALGGQNPKYTVQCLVEGVWTTVAEFHDSDTTPISHASYEDAMKNDTSFYHMGSNISIKLAQPITTNNVRVTLSEYGKNYQGGDVLVFPYIYEIELMGKLGKTPELELPEGAVISTNIAYHSFPEASSSRAYRYPYLAIDGNTKTYWSPKVKEAGAYYDVVLNEAKSINKVVLNFGQYLDGMTPTDYKFVLSAYVDDQWVELATGTSFDEEGLTLITEYIFEEVLTNRVRLTFTEAFNTLPTLYEFETHLSTGKTYYVENRFTSSERTSASKGNIAIIGTPYANLDFVPYSDVNYINDGGILKESYVWFTGVIDMPAYCGIKFDKIQTVNKVALYANIPDEEGADCMDVEIQAFIDGEYVTLVKGKSYHELMKYTTVYEFAPVETDDIRILFTRGNGTFAHLKELEIYSPDGIIPMFDGLEAMAEPPQVLTSSGDAENENVKVSYTNEIQSEQGAQINLPTVKEETSDNVFKYAAIASLVCIASALSYVIVRFVRKKQQ